MKKTLLTSSLLFLFLAIAVLSSAQITINNSDMPSVNDIFIYENVTPSPAIDPLPTGNGFNWDFSTLTSASQQPDTFVSLLNIGSIYALAFIGSSHAVRNANDISLFGQLNFTHIFDIYKNSSSKYEYSGQGADINSIPTPMAYSPRDVVYRFPLTAGNAADSSASGFSVTLPGIGDYSKSRKRVNEVDGYGTLSIPSGTFNVVRVKSTISDIDSLTITGFPFPFGIPSTSIEYKWLGKQQGVPLLQINANQFGIVSLVRYLGNPVVGIEDINNQLSDLTVFPNPAASVLKVQSSKFKVESIEIYDMKGMKIKMLTGIAPSSSTTVDISGWSEGIYLLKVISEKNIVYRKFAVAR
jgi:hypothetical protein